MATSSAGGGGLRASVWGVAVGSSPKPGRILSRSGGVSSMRSPLWRFPGSWSDGRTDRTPGGNRGRLRSNGAARTTFLLPALVAAVSRARPTSGMRATDPARRATSQRPRPPADAYAKLVHSRFWMRQL
jgi:hypothetical protein